MTPRWAGVGAALLLGVLAGGESGAGEAAPTLWRTLESPSAAVTPAGVVPIGSFSQMAERSWPAVVAVIIRARPAGSGAGAAAAEPLSPFPFNPWRLFPEVPEAGRAGGFGSGFVIRADGLIVTNHHVVAGATHIQVRVQGLGAALPARLVGGDPRSDLALLQVDPPRPLPVLPLGSSGDLAVGSWVVAIGNPFGLTAIVTKGILSGKGRTLGDSPAFAGGTYDFLQTDAAIDRGNSGGPLLNLRGEVVGINTAINSRARGIGFAVPVDLAKAVLPHLWREGRVAPSFIGVNVDQVTWELAESFGMTEPVGVLVTRVLPGRPADRAGLKAGDVIVSFDGQPVQGQGDLNWRVATSWVDRPVVVEVWRQRQRLALAVTPAVKQGDRPPASAPSPPPARVEAHQLGLKVVALDPATAQVAGLPEGQKGMVVVAAEGDSATYGLRMGDLIVTINDAAVDHREAFERAIRSVPQGQMIRFYLLRQNQAFFIALPRRWD